MSNQGLFKHNLRQADTVIDKLVDLPVVNRSDVSSTSALESQLNTEIPQYIIELERVYKVLLGDTMHFLASHLFVSDAPDVYADMRKSLLGEHQETLEQQVLIFLNEFHETLDEEITAFRTGNTVLRPHGPYGFLVLRSTDGWSCSGRDYKIPVDTEVGDAQYVEAKARLARRVLLRPEQITDPPEQGRYYIHVCYSMGNFRDHFIEYFKKIYRRVRHIHAFIDFCSECVWINQSVVQFRLGGQILNDEVGGVKFTYRQPSSNNVFALYGDFLANISQSLPGSGRIITIEDNGKTLPVSYALIENIQLHATGTPTQGLYDVPVSIRNENIIHVENTGDQAIDVKAAPQNNRDAKVTILSIAKKSSVDIPAQHFRKVISFTKV